MSKYWKHSNDDDLEKQEVEIEEEKTEPTLINDSGYIAVRRITYEWTNPAIKVAVGAKVPMEIINDDPVFKNLLSKGAIVKED